KHRALTHTHTLRHSALPEPEPGTEPNTEHSSAVMKLSTATFLFLTALELGTTGINCVPEDEDTGDLCALLSKLRQVKDKRMTKELGIVLEALFKAFSDCDVLTTADPSTTPKTSTDPNKTLNPPPSGQQGTDPSTTPKTSTDPNKTLNPPPSGQQGTDHPTPPKPRTDLRNPTSPASTPPAQHGTVKSETTKPEIKMPNAKVSKASILDTPPHDHSEKEKTANLPKSDKKFLWILLGGLAALMIVTIIILKSKILMCTRILTNADVAGYVEEKKKHGKNDDIILLGVTPWGETEEDNSNSPRGSVRYEDVLPRVTY
ncbi:hypothetical protein AGOR_G00193860, partial [Albula goreensis]